MNLKEIEYILKIAEEKNITHAAEKLFITPSALNQQLLNLERELETPLFIRSRNNWSLTEAGEIYIKNAKEILKLKIQTYSKLQDIIATKKGTLSIGLPPERGGQIFINIYKKFYQKYPNIKIKVFEMSVRQQQQLISLGELDIGFMSLASYQQTSDEYIKLYSEKLILAVPSENPICKSVYSKDNIFPELDLKLLQYHNFALINKESTLFEIVKNIFKQENISPNILFETSRANTILEMVSNNLCCGIVPSFITRESKRNVSFFTLPNSPSWNIVVSYKKGNYLTKPAKYFINLFKEYSL